MSKFFLFVGCLQALFATVALGTSGHAQILEETYISSNWDNLKLEAAFADIQRQTDFFFTYNYDAIHRIRVSNKQQNLPLAGLLKYLSGKSNLKFQVEEEIIYVTVDEQILEAPSRHRLNLEVPPTLELQQLAQLENTKIIYQLSSLVSGDDRLVKGVVKSAEGEPLVGATVLVRSTGNGTVTDVDGSFSIIVPDEEDVVLIVSYVGYDSKYISLNNRAQLEIILDTSSTELDEVLVIGYGTDTKEKFNGAVSKVDNNTLNNYSAASFDQAIAGTVSGVQISGNNKNPGENSVIQIRGINTLTAGTNPLIVVDGNPLTEGSALSAINTQDIESISVLKDAASAAIYGSRASNGVILITTKKGQEGKLRVTYDGYLGFQERIDNFELADAYGTARFDFDARNFGYLSGGEGRSISDDNATRDANGGGKRSRVQPFLQDYLNGTPGLTNTDWADAVFRTAPQQNHYLNLSGGSSNTDYSVSFGYFDQENIVVEADYQRYTTNFQINSQINDFIRFGVTSNAAFSTSRPVGYRGWSDFNLGAQPDPAQAIMLMFPYYSVYEEDGSLAVDNQLQDNNDNWDGPISGNAVATMALTDHSDQDFRLFGNTYLEIEPLPGLKFRTSFGGDYTTGTEEFFAPSTLGNYRLPVANSLAMSFKSDTRRENYITENLLSYNLSTGAHSFDVLGGYSYQQEFRNRTRLESEDFVDDNLRNISGAVNPLATSVSSKWALESVFSRLQYGFDNRYSLSGSLRRDGSSRFGANTKYGTFASLSAGWTLSNETFFPDSDLVSFAKLRASWGQTGNNQIGDFASIALVDQDNYVVDGGLVAGSYTRTSPNADLSWETNTSLNLGVDLGFLDNKLLLTAEYYTSNTTDLLLSVPVPQQSGFSTSLQNIGELDNRGFEFELRGRGFKLGAVDFGFNANIFTNENQIVALGAGQTQIIQGNGGMDFITRVGDPMAQFYAYDVIGVYRSAADLEAETITPLPGTEVGDYIVRDVNGDGQITPDDRTVLGDYNPDFTYGIGLNFGYKGFDLALQFNGIEGRKAADRMIRNTESGEGFFVPSQYYVDNYFTDDNPDGFFRRPDFSSFSSAGRLTRSSNLTVLDADYFRLRSLQIGYNFPREWVQRVGIEGLRLYITGNNVFNISDFRGYNPDGIDNRSNTRQTLTRGWIQTTNPLTRFMAFGVNVRF
ncbi:TonB-dependent receptor [Phaeodactylibacter sp.]|uniref:SusC/RagA family TonB-linked outer membrane protein n=1 Tax=Phaeodactylibacter sp. TaxID=1940289 RepID=UPI0025E65C39|nr:TonB-dependent receptor [Phaeodactylibacter sp.]MCI4648484.1 TonB-dependent receptor [Phaeodactylibacter sp.]MCI5090962.1 TonB-dependent receptor [Phaeodactylibacter sp.]